jgi:sugar porter (SP) family MFS transporter
MLVNAQTRIVVAASLAGLLFGFDTAVIAGVTHALREVYTLSPAGLGAIVSVALWGTLLGALLAGIPGDRFGSRNALRVVGLLYVFGALGCALSASLAEFAVARFLTGIAIGASSVLAPVYIAEIAPHGRRGALVGLFQLNIVIGILLAYCSNFAIDHLVSGAVAWRWKLGVATVPAGVFLSLLFTIPHSPRWLLARGRAAEAAASLAHLGEPDPAVRLDQLRRMSVEAGTQAGGSLSWTVHRRAMLLAIAIATFNQLSGINAVLYYLGDIFAAAGFSTLSADLQSMVVGGTNLVATLLALRLIDRIGRRPLLLFGAVGTALALAGVAVIMALQRGQALLLPLLVAFIASFAVSQGAVIWVYLSELFPTAVRARGQSLGSATHWIMNALIAAIFPSVAAVSKSLPFVFFALMMVVQFVVVKIAFPETKGVALEDMTQRLATRRSPS